jgi:hypothetical protein
MIVKTLLTLPLREGVYYSSKAFQELAHVWSKP